MDLLQRARGLYQSGELRDALEAAQAAAERAPKDPEAWWLLALIARHAGLPQASDQAFARAAALSRRKSVPVRVSEAAFRALVDAARGALSPDAKRRLESTEVVIAHLPSEADIRSGVKPDAPSRRVRRPADVLTVYQDNLENRSATPDELGALVTKTLSRA
jgi:tetratricopeptide (TPR) repeat protein